MTTESFSDDSWDDFSEVPRDPTARRAAEALVVDVEGYEGPLDLLLVLSRSQKVDLRRISVLQLAEQYLAFVEHARALRIELAADYLVMAAWLAYLKSRLLLPPDPAEDGPSGAELAAHLAFQLERLQAMREAAARLMARDRKGQDFFARGHPEDATPQRVHKFDVSLLDLLRAYARLRTRDEFRPYAFDRTDVYSPEEALARLVRMLGAQPGEWRALSEFLPEDWRTSPARRRAATATSFAASLELVRQGEARMRQAEAFTELQLCGTTGGARAWA